MLNIDNFIKRLETLLDYYGLNASSFADRINVQRSSMSHLLSGRNKPSLDFVMKIVEVFPEVDLYWLLNGIGDFPQKSQPTENHRAASDVEELKKYTPLPFSENVVSPDLFSKISFEEEEKKSASVNQPEFTNSTLEKKEDEIERIVFFYKNGTFKVYNP